MSSIENKTAGLLPQELCSYLGLSPSFRGKQVFKWISRGVSSFSEMTDLPESERERLASIPLFSSKVEQKLESPDGSVKLKIRLDDGSAIESVLLCDGKERLTACLSTQVGCQMACAFCKTGTLGFLRNLRADEIIEQFLALSKLRGSISNIVFMGMGEPLNNLENVRKAIEIFTHPDSFAMSKRKITISTCGIVPKIIDLADNGPHVRLAISLTAASDELRSSLMPVNKSWNLKELHDAISYYQSKTKDRITLEAAIIGEKNCDTASANAMADWIGSLNVQVNLIPWNPISVLPLVEPKLSEVENFEKILEKRGINVVRRAKKGRSVSGACGQLGETLQ